MANLSKPKRGKGPAPKPQEASNNLGPEAKVLRNKYMSFKIEESFLRRFKQRALDDSITMTELLKRSFEHYDQTK